MGFLGSVKNKMFGRKETDLSELRSAVFGEPREPRPMAEPLERPLPERPRFEEIPPSLPEAYGPPYGFEREGLTLEPLPEETRPESSYEIIDRLKIIESQLSAIRSQTELINERLKNMEMKFSRRY